MENTLNNLTRLKENEHEVENKDKNDLGEVLQLSATNIKLLNELREKDREIREMKETYAGLKRQVEHMKKRRKDSKNNSKKNKKNNTKWKER